MDFDLSEDGAKEFYWLTKVFDALFCAYLGVVVIDRMTCMIASEYVLCMLGATEEIAWYWSGLHGILWVPVPVACGPIFSFHTPGRPKMTGPSGTTRGPVTGEPREPRGGKAR